MADSRHSRSTDLDQPLTPPARLAWQPADVVALVVAVCYGAATLVVAAAIFLRLVQ